MLDFAIQRVRIVETFAPVANVSIVAPEPIAYVPLASLCESIRHRVAVDSDCGRPKPVRRWNQHPTLPQYHASLFGHVGILW
jgi:hypothetical protein